MCQVAYPLLEPVLSHNRDTIWVSQQSTIWTLEKRSENTEKQNQEVSTLEELTCEESVHTKKTVARNLRGK